MTKVLLADDSPLVRAVLRDIFRETPYIQVVGEAENGKEAIELTANCKPDLIIMDLMMPVMGGLEAIEEIMASHPTPILVLSATVDEREVNEAFVAIKKGALDIMEKPAGGGLDVDSGFAARIVDKVRLLSRIKVIHHHRRKGREENLQVVQKTRGERKVLAIGASTGGPRAVMTLLKGLPSGFNASVLIVQHIANGFTKGFVQWLNSESGIKVRMARHGDPLEPGMALVAPDDVHMTLDNGRICLVSSEPVNSCRPSIDVLFESVAAEVGGGSVGVLLTGMGRDGASGLLRIRNQGGTTVVQDEASCVVFGMPKVAISLGAADKVLPLPRIPEALVTIFS